MLEYLLILLQLFIFKELVNNLVISDDQFSTLFNLVLF